MTKMQSPRRFAAGQSLRALALASSMLMPGLALADAAVSVESDAAVAHPGAAFVGATSASKVIALSIVLPSRDPAGAESLAHHVAEPGDALYRQYLRPEAYAARFGADAADYAAVRAWAVAQGLTPGEEYTAHTVLPVSGSVAAIEAAFGVKISDYRDAKGRVFYATDRDASLPSGIAAKLVGVLGLSSATHFVPLARIKPAGAAPMESGTGPGAAFLAADLRTAYSVPAQAFAAKTQTLAVFEQGGFDPNDVAVYLAKNKLPAVPVVVRSVDGYGGGIDDPGVELEAVLDIDMQIGMNPAAKKIIVYEDGFAESFQVDILDSFSAMATDNVAKSISVSYGQDETLQGKTAVKAEYTVLLQLVSQGQALFVSSGDNGAYGDGSLPLNVSDPSSQPKVTAVGGTTLFTGPHEEYFAEEAWNNLGIGEGATGGGVSIFWKEPSYQIIKGELFFTTANGGSNAYRNVPDVAAVGSPLTGVAVYSKLNGGWVTIGGTSVSAPIWAGVYSLANAASEGLGFGAIGFANPPLYQIDTTYGFFGPDLNDVVDGTNGNASAYDVPGFNAGYGYDNTTGLGSFNGSNLIPELALLPIRKAKSPPAIPTELKATVSSGAVTLTWKPVTGATGYLVTGFDENTYGSLPNLLQKVTAAKYSGLVRGSVYELTVSAVSAGGLATAAPVIVTAQ
jgi:kumamolisin